MNYIFYIIFFIFNIFLLKLFTYRPSLLEVLKNAWIQYLSFYILLGLLLRPFKAFIFENQVIRTRMTVDRVPGERNYKLHQF